MKIYFPNNSVAAALVLAFLLSAWPDHLVRAQDKDDAKAAHALFEKAIKKKKAPERLAALREASARFPLAAELHYELGREFYQLAQLDSAAARFERVVVLDEVLTQKTSLRKILASAYATIASQRFGRGKLISAVEAALAGLKHDSNSVPCLATATVAYQQLGEYDQAISTGLRLIALQPSAQNHNNLGAAYESKGQWLAAKEHYSQALALAPSRSEAQNNLNRVNLRIAQLAAAAAPVSPAAPAGKQLEKRGKVSTQEIKPAVSKAPTKNTGNAPPPKIAKPARAEVEAKPKASPRTFTPEKAPASKTKAPERALTPPSPGQTKIEPLVQARDSSETAALEKRATSEAGKTVRHQDFSLGIWGLAGLASILFMMWWKFFPHKALALRFALEKMLLRIGLFGRSWKSKQPGEKSGVQELRPVLRAPSRRKRKRAKDKKRQTQTPLPAAARDEQTANESQRMLHRAAAPPAELESSGLAFTSPAHKSKRLVEEVTHNSQNGNVPAPAVVEDSIVPESEAGLQPAPAPEKAAPPIGLQTEMLFAEMISGALAPLDEANENGHSGNNELNVEASPARDGHEEAGLQTSETGLLPVKRVEAVPALPHANGRTEDKTPVLDFAPDPRTVTMPALSSDALALREHSAEIHHEELMEMTTMGLVAGVKEMMDEPIACGQAATLSATPAAPGLPAETAMLLATRTMEISALSAARIGRYIIGKEIAKGTTGRIYKAWDPKLDRTVVLKTVQYGFATSTQEIAGLKDRIYREARAIAKLSHPNIVIVYDVDDQPEFSYLVMEYLEGRDLKQVLEAERLLECERALHIVMQVCEAMEYAHRSGVFHRDVKPSNIMLLENDETKVTDFGIAKISNYLSLTQTGRVLGTPSYMAPEQIEGQDTDGRADLFSLGIVLYELIAGKRPFVADSLAALAYKIVHKPHIPPSLENVEIPMELDEVLQRALAKNPDERYQNALEFQQALAAVRARLLS